MIQSPNDHPKGAYIGRTKWGTLKLIWEKDKMKLLMETQNVLFDTYNEDQLDAVPDMPTQWISLFKRIPWSVVSKAALKSSSTLIEHMPQSAFIKRSLVTLRRAVSVLWYCWNPVLNFSKIMLFSTAEKSCFETISSRFWEIKGSLEIGQ